MCEKQDGRVEIPESRWNALQTCMSQMRLARKSLLTVGVDGGLEDSILEDISEALKSLTAYAEDHKPVRTRERRGKESSVEDEIPLLPTDTEDPRSEFEKVTDREAELGALRGDGS